MEYTKDDEELLTLFDILKEKDVKFKDLLIKVYDLETGKEGWVSVLEMIYRLEKEVNKKQKKEDK